MTASRGGSRTSRAAAGPGLSGAARSDAVPPDRPRVSPWGLLRAAHGGPTLAVTTLVAVLAAGRGGRARRPGCCSSPRCSPGSSPSGGSTTSSTSAATARSDAPTSRWRPASCRSRRSAPRWRWRPSRPWCCRSPSAWRGRAGPPRPRRRVGPGLQPRSQGAPSSRGCPYAVAFGTLPAVVTLAGPAPAWPEAWLMLAAGTPRRRGALPQRAAGPGRRRRHGRARSAAPAGGARQPGRGDRRCSSPRRWPRCSGRAGAPEPWAWGLLAGRPGPRRWSACADAAAAPFRAAIGIALVDVVLVALG